MSHYTRDVSEYSLTYISTYLKDGNTMTTDPTTEIDPPHAAAPEQLPDGEFMFEHEMALYREDPETYKARTPPAFLVKLMAVDEERRQRAIAEQREAARKKADLSTLSSAEIEQQILAALGISRGSGHVR